MKALLCLLFAGALFADPGLQKTFEQSYLQLQNKLGTLRAKGEKVSARTQKEIDDLMAQMNHEHTELKRQLEKKNQELKQKINEGRKSQEDWSDRLSRAVHELTAGVKRAWNTVSGPSESRDDHL